MLKPYQQKKKLTEHKTYKQAKFFLNTCPSTTLLRGLLFLRMKGKKKKA